MKRPSKNTMLFILIASLVVGSFMTAILVGITKNQTTEFVKQKSLVDIYSYLEIGASKEQILSQIKEKPKAIYFDKRSDKFTERYVYNLYTGRIFGIDYFELFFENGKLVSVIRHSS